MDQSLLGVSVKRWNRVMPNIYPGLIITSASEIAHAQLTLVYAKRTRIHKQREYSEVARNYTCIVSTEVPSIPGQSLWWYVGSRHCTGSHLMLSYPDISVHTRKTHKMLPKRVKHVNQQSTIHMFWYHTVIILQAYGQFLSVVSYNRWALLLIECKLKNSIDMDLPWTNCSQEDPANSRLMIECIPNKSWRRS